MEKIHLGSEKKTVERARIRVLWLAAADELDDFVAVAGFDVRILPLRARQDFQISFDGNASRFEAQFTQQIRNCGVRIRRAAFSIHGNCDRGFHRLTRRGHPGPRAQLKTKMPFGVCFRSFNDQCRLGARQARHFKFELSVPERTRFGEQLQRLGSTIHPRRHLSAFDRVVGLIPNRDLQHGMFAGEPGLGVEQF